jgi:hypothetical protein
MWNEADQLAANVEILGTKNQLLIKSKTYNYLDRREAKH